MMVQFVVHFWCTLHQKCTAQLGHFVFFVIFSFEIAFHSVFMCQIVDLALQYVIDFAEVLVSCQ